MIKTKVINYLSAINSKYNFKTILTFMLITAVLAFLFTYTASKNYEVKALIKIGHAPGAPIESSLITKQRILSKSVHETVKKQIIKITPSASEREIDEIGSRIQVIEYKDDTTLEIKITGNNAQLLENYLQLSVRDLIQKHDQIISPLLESYKEELAYFKKIVTILETYKLTDQAIREEATDIKNKIFKIEKIIDFDIQKTVNVDDIQVSKNLFSEHAKVNIELGLILGFFLGVFFSNSSFEVADLKKTELSHT